MDIKQLTYFLAIAEEGNISKAAERLHMAQPPLSQQLKLLEEELDATLIERSTRKLQITDIGERLQYRAKQILELVDTTIKEVEDINKGFQGMLSIGTVSSAGAALLPEKLSSFHEKYPGINFEIIDEDTYKIIELLNNGIIDIGIIRTPFNLDMFESKCLPVVPMVAISKNLQLTSECETLSMTDLTNKPLIVQHRYEKIIIELCHKSGFEPRILCRSNDVRTILLWASTGMGIAIVPNDCISLIQSVNLEHRKINEPSLNVGTAIIWTKDHYQSSAANHFLNEFII